MLCISNYSEFQVDSGVYVVKFGADWCGPCKKMEPNLIKLESEFTDIKFVSVDIDQVPILAQKYKVKSIPTLIFIRDGKEVERIAGLSLIEPIRSILRALSKECAA